LKEDFIYLFFYFVEEMNPEQLTEVYDYMANYHIKNRVLPKFSDLKNQFLSKYNEYEGKRLLSLAINLNDTEHYFFVLLREEVFDWFERNENTGIQFPLEEQGKLIELVSFDCSLQKSVKNPEIIEYLLDDSDLFYTNSELEQQMVDIYNKANPSKKVLSTREEEEEDEEEEQCYETPRKLVLIEYESQSPPPIQSKNTKSLEKMESKEHVLKKRKIV
jgi:hypothetical protein